MTQILLCTLVSCLITTAQRASGQEVDTTHGKVVGLRASVLGKSIDTYYGIPYAKPPIGDLRFKYPQPIDPWRPEVKDALSMKPSCHQTAKPANGMPWRAIPPLFSEDCLYINVWAPANVTSNTKLATMVWIYGGGFVTGSINRPLHNGQYLAAENNVIVMSMNYRLGAHGFLYLGPDTFPGNQGLMDQALALQWIQNNVERFGGDASMITLFGESAGAASIGLHLLSPISRDFFTRAILESGSPDATWASMEPSKAIRSTRRLAELSSCSGKSDADIFQCIKDVPSETILQYQALLLGAFIPVVDGHFLPDSPSSLVEKGQMKQTEILLGVNENEGSLFLPEIMPTLFPVFASQINVNKTQFLTTVKSIAAFSGQSSTMVKAVMAQYAEVHVPSLHPDYVETACNVVGDSYFVCPAVKLAASYSVKQNTYLYSFNYRLSSLQLPLWMGVPHSFEIEMVFGHPIGGAIPASEGDMSTSRNVMTYWTNFAKTGNPNLPETPSFQWPGYNTMDERFLVFSASGQSTDQGLRKQQCVFWNSLVPLILEKEETSTGSGNSFLRHALPADDKTPGLVQFGNGVWLPHFWFIAIGYLYFISKKATTENVVYRCHTSGSRLSFTVDTCLVAVLATLVSL